MSTVDVIAKAISEKKSLSFGYHGFERVVSPYACGITPVNEIKLIAFQTDGGSTSGVTEKLRFFSVEDILGPEISEAPFRVPECCIKDACRELSHIYSKVE